MLNILFHIMKVKWVARHFMLTLNKGFYAERFDLTIFLVKSMSDLF